MSEYSPVSIKESPVTTSSTKNLTGNPRIARDIVADVYNTIQKWNDYHIQGAKIVKLIANSKSNQLNDFSNELQELTIELYNIVGKCCDMVGAIYNLSQNMLAVHHLQKDETYLFISMSTQRMVDILSSIHDAYTRELKNKQTVLENIAHSKCTSEAVFFATLWSYQIHITPTVVLDMEALLIETGHKKIM